MAKVENFPVITKANVNNDHVLYLVNQNVDTDHKIVLNTLFPTIANIGSAGQAIHNSLTNITQFNLRKIAAASYIIRSINSYYTFRWTFTNYFSRS